MVQLPLNIIATGNDFIGDNLNNNSLKFISSQKFLLADILKASALFLLVLWTILANFLVFIVLYKNPRLQTVPNLLVGNLALSDFCLALIVLPLSSVYACAGEWLFNDTLCQIFVSADILCSTASIWNLSIVGLDRYWAITSPVAYLNKRNKKTACIMIVTVWSFSALISLAPLLGWKQVAEHGNLVELNGTWQCTFLDLPSYTVYSATGSFFIPTLLMFFVYFKIYQAFAKHRARQIYRQKVIRRHIESTILHEISHILPTSDEFAKDADEDEDDEEEVVDRPPYFEDEECVCRNLNENDTRRAHSTTAVPVLPLQHSIIYEEEEDASTEDSPEKSEKSDKSADSSNNEEPVRKEKDCSNIKESSPSNAILSRVNGQTKTGSPQTPKVTFKHPNDIPEDEEDAPVTPTTAKRKMLLQSKKQWKSFGYVENSLGKQSSIEEEDSSSPTKISPTQKQPNNIIKALIKKRNSEGTTEDLNNPLKIQQMILKNKNGRIGGNSTAMPTYEKVRRHKRRKELNLRKSLQTRPRTISAAKERRGVRVLGIILGCFTLCWTPFFVMYVFVQFCAYCSVNPHIEMFITWLGYSNSAMNPIIYTVFNRDYQVALKRIFLGRRSGGGSSGIRSTLQRPICPIR
uniref:G-protein coupled receptors family 1 profile domain-containing protein n=1 Tax=Meloidogyne enterolobii TaxID=390850 RepID=A0A6V7VQL2_MELEN|nr:unnamed protein product [Meloidogyne enterolobii]